jgi:DNA-binding transcriptional ArsR family regulator
MAGGGGGSDQAENTLIMRRDVFQAIADPTRRAIIMLLATQAMTPNALATHFETSRQAVSKHLQVLAECELVKPAQEGREIHYHVNAKKMQEIEKWLQQFKAILEKRFRQLDEVLEKLKKHQNGKERRDGKTK